MAAGKINLQANNGKVLSLVAPDGMSANEDVYINTKLWQNKAVTINVTADADYTLTVDENTYGRIIETDTGVLLTATRNVIVDNIERSFLYQNNTLQSRVVKTAAGTGITVVAGMSVSLLCDSVNVRATENDKLPLTGGTMTGAITALRETKVAMGAKDIALASGNVFTKTITATTTLTVSGWLASGNANSFILELTNGGAFPVTYFAGVKWAGGIAPTLTASGVDILGFYSHDGGTTVRGILLSKDSK
jgi:hypothetical protein